MRPTDDERLLIGEIRRALARLRAIRTILDELHSEQLVSPEAYERLVKLTREVQG